MKLGITGGNGFVGSALSAESANRGHAVTVFGRSAPREKLPWSYERSKLDDVSSIRQALMDVDVVVHLAARVHVMKDKSADPLSDFRQVNVGLTRNVAQAAAQASVKRFVFMSTLKVNGDLTCESAFTEESTPNPKGPYAISKWEAEQELRRIADNSSMEYVIIRPPLVYGPGVRANFLRLWLLVESGLPLPLASVKNRRDLVSLSNLVDAILFCAEESEARNQVFLVSDGEAISTPELIRRISSVQGRSPRVFPFPAMGLKVLGFLLGKKEIVGRLCESLEANSSKLRGAQGWTPPVKMKHELELIKEFLNRTSE